MSAGDSRSDGSFRSDTARADIEATRERMGETLDELGARLNPNRLKQQAKDKVRDATIGRVQTMAQTTIDKAKGAGRSVTDVVRENPIPSAMIAAGISWLVWSARRSGSSAQPEYAQPEPNRNKASEAAGNVKDAAQRAREATTGAATNVAQTAKEKSDKIADAFQSNPLPLGLVAAALGLAAGYSVPSTQKEGELVGEKRDELVDKARELVTEKKDQAERVAKRVVSEAKSTATQVAREEGLTSP